MGRSKRPMARIRRLVSKTARSKMLQEEVAEVLEVSLDKFKAWNGGWIV